jgi:hypothetical protein
LSPQGYNADPRERIEKRASRDSYQGEMPGLDYRGGMRSKRGVRDELETWQMDESSLSNL